MTDDRIEMLIGNLLRAGVVSSGIIVAAGGIWYLAAKGREDTSYGTFHATTGGLKGLAGLPHPQMLILAGLLLLIATPIARVIFAVAGFALEKDWMYCGISLAVLAVLLYSISTAL